MVPTVVLCQMPNKRPNRRTVPFRDGVSDAQLPSAVRDFYYMDPTAYITTFEAGYDYINVS